MDRFEPDSKRPPSKGSTLAGLEQETARALERAIERGDLVPMLHKLVQTAPSGSEESLFALRQLAELIVERHPWRAALYARRVLEHRPEDERGWATLALCHTMMGHYRSAVGAYGKALAVAPDNPWYAHNLGHLLDVALGDPATAIRWLRRAYTAAPWSDDVVMSFAHALARANKGRHAKQLLLRASRRSPSTEFDTLLAWLESGDFENRAHPPMAPPRTSEGQALSHPSPSRATSGSVESFRLRGQRGSSDSTKAPTAERTTHSKRQRGRDSDASEPRLSDALERALSRGLPRLPLSDGQRAHALVLARDVEVARSSSAWKLADSQNDGTHAPSPNSPTSPNERHAIQGLAAAVAYAIVFIDRIPLSQAEVAASFRVSVAAVRSAFFELRSCLDLTPGDVRYRSVRGH